MPDPASWFALHTVPTPPATAWTRALWILPLLASLAFVAGVMWWMYGTEQADRDERRATLITDTLGTEARLTERLEVETALVQALAQELPHVPRSVAGLESSAALREGLRRFWISVTWLDAQHRIIAHVPSPALLSGASASRGMQEMEQSAHFTVRAGNDQVVVRYLPSQLLRRAAPWWLTRKYDVQLIDSADQVLASVDASSLRTAADDRETYRVMVSGPLPGAYLELTTRELTLPFWRTAPLVLATGFVVAMCIATLLLRRQMRRISSAESAWRTEAAWRQAMEDSALVGLRARDIAGRVLYVNRTFCHMVGLPEQALIGLLPPMPYWPPDSVDDAMSRNLRNLAGNAPREGYEARWRHSDGRVLDVMVFESPLVDAQGRHMGWMGSIIDISAHKQLQERERRRTEAMAHQSRLTTLGEVASALAHQLNQPLTAIMGYNAGLQHMLLTAGNADATVLEALRHQGEQAAEAGRVVQRIREFLTRRAPQREACDLGAVAHKAVDLLRADLQRMHIGLQWAVAPQLPPVYADPVLLEQVVINLVRNAADALRDLAQTSDGEPAEITLAVQATPGSGVCLNVEDNGPGLGGLGVETLTTAFYSTKSEGMGMGLAICRSIVELHHGHMEAGISSRGGASLRVTMPLVQHTQPPPSDHA